MNKKPHYKPQETKSKETEFHRIYSFSLKITKFLKPAWPGWVAERKLIVKARLIEIYFCSREFFKILYPPIGLRRNVAGKEILLLDFMQRRNGFIPIIDFTFWIESVRGEENWFKRIEINRAIFFFFLFLPRWDILRNNSHVCDNAFHL